MNERLGCWEFISVMQFPTPYEEELFTKIIKCQFFFFNLILLELQTILPLYSEKKTRRIILPTM
jgi:hypothetical protein